MKSGTVKEFTKQLIPSGEEICKSPVLHFIGKTKEVEVKEDEIYLFTGQDKQIKLPNFVVPNN